MSDDLKPCPFCGNQLIFGDVAWNNIPVVTCSGCPTITDIKTAYRRTPPPATAELVAFIGDCLDVAGVGEVNITEDLGRRTHAEWGQE